jgi:hypothetical protein
MLAALVVGSDRTSRTASHGVMATLTDGRTEKVLEIQTMIGESGIETAALQRRRMASRDEPNSKEAGSVMRTPRRSPIPMRINHSYETENGAVIDTVQTATGPAVLNSSKSPSGWIAMTAMSHDVHIRRKTLSVGRRE